jgi:hypothetical protein
MKKPVLSPIGSALFDCAPTNVGMPAPRPMAAAAVISHLAFLIGRSSAEMVFLNQSLSPQSLPHLIFVKNGLVRAYPHDVGFPHRASGKSDIRM